MKRLLLVVVMTTLISACATVSAPLNGSALAQLAPGKTTLAQATVALGRQPSSSTASSKGTGNVLHQWVDGARMVGLVFDAQGTLVRAMHVSNIPLATEDRARLFAGAASTD